MNIPTLLQRAGFALLLALVPPCADAQSVHDGFLPSVDGPVLTMARDHDNGFVIGGDFDRVDGILHQRLARLHHDGTLDTSFAAQAIGGAVRAVLPDAEGRIVIGGDFTHADLFPRPRLARIAADGNLDESFSPVVDGVIHALAHDVSDDRLYVAGEFSTVNGQPRRAIARLDADGTLDAGFVPHALTGNVYAIAVQPDGRVLIGGTLGPGGSHPIDHRLYRLMPDGSLDAGFSARVDALGIMAVRVLALALRDDGRILVGGQFDRVNGSVRAHVAQLRQDGSLDTTFAPPTLSARVNTLAVQADGRVLIGGDFTGLTMRNRIARLHEDGSLDSTFARSVEVDDEVFALVPDDDGSVVMAGRFQDIDGTSYDHIARLMPDGLPEEDFDSPTLANTVTVSVTAHDGSILIGGHFTSVDEISRAHLARTSAAGLVDATFRPDPDGAVHAIALQENGRIVVGGEFSQIGDANARGLARLYPNGLADADFALHDFNGTVRSIVTLPDGRLLVGGDFTLIDGIAHRRIARLHADGSVDTSFHAGTIDGPIHAMGVLTDGRIAIGGGFSEVAGEPRGGLAVLEADGALDGVIADTNGTVLTIAPHSSNTFAFGGTFTSVNGTPFARTAMLRPNGEVDSWSAGADGTVHTLTWMDNGRLLLGGAFHQIASQTRHGLALLKLNGNEVHPFDADIDLDGGSVRSITVQPDGKLMLAGAFASVRGVARANLARVAAPEPTRQGIVYTPATGRIGWLHDNFAQRGLAPAELLVSQTCCDADDFAPLPGGSTMYTVGGGWLLPAPWLPEGIWYARARLRIGDHAGSTSMLSPIARVRGSDVVEDDTLFRDGFDPEP